MCQGLMEDLELFKKEFLPLFTQLCDDKVVNVRIAAAKVLASHFERKTAASKDNDIIKLYAKLSKDPSPDIIKIVNREHTFLEDGYSSGSSEHIRSRTSSASAVSENPAQTEDKALPNPEDKKTLQPLEPKSPEKDIAEPEIPEAESQTNQENPAQQTSAPQEPKIEAAEPAQVQLTPEVPKQEATEPVEVDATAAEPKPETAEPVPAEATGDEPKQEPAEPTNIDAPEEAAGEPESASKEATGEQRSD